jgi:hypothetical protein
MPVCARNCGKSGCEFFVTINEGIRRASCNNVKPEVVDNCISYSEAGLIGASRDWRYTRIKSRISLIFNTSHLDKRRKIGSGNGSSRQIHPTTSVGLMLVMARARRFGVWTSSWVSQKSRTIISPIFFFSFILFICRVYSPSTFVVQGYIQRCTNLRGENGRLLLSAVYMTIIKRRWAVLRSSEVVRFWVTFNAANSGVKLMNIMTEHKYSDR